MDELEWLNSLKEGDEAAAHDRWNGTYVVKVLRVTGTQIITERGARYRRTDGRQVGATGFHKPYIMPVTHGLRDKLRKAALRTELTKAIAKADLPVLDALVVALKAAHPVERKGGE